MCTQVIRREITSTPWQVVPKDPKFKDSPPAAVQREIDYVTYFLNSCNENKETIEDLVSMAVQDLLELDAGAFVKGFSGNSYITTPAGGLELAPMGQRDLAEIWSRDGGSFLAETDVNGVKYRWWQYSYLHPAIAPLEFDINEIAYFMQYQRSYSVYGWSPLQSMDTVLSSLINSAAWNSTFFAEATLPSGIIGVENMNPEELERFRQYFRTEIKGKWHRIAVVNSDVKYVPFALTNRDMQWLDGQQWYAKLVMALYNITPTELGFTDDIRATGKAMGAQEEVQKRKSTMPILRKLEQVINNQIVSELSQNVMFQFKPVDRSEELMQIDVDNKDMELGKVPPNEIRKKRGLGEPQWWGEEPLEIIKARIMRGEPIPPLQLPQANEPQSPQQAAPLQRAFKPALTIRKDASGGWVELANNKILEEDGKFLQAFRSTSVGKAWPPVMNPLTGQPHTQDDTVPKEQYDAADENARFQQRIGKPKDISGNRIGWGKEQREDYLGQQSETIPGANQRGQLPTAIGRKPGEYDARDGMMNPTDVGGEAGAYPIKPSEQSKKPVPTAMGVRTDIGPNANRLGPSGTEKPYDDTIDLRKQRQRPETNPPANQITQGDPLGSYGQHPWEDAGGHRGVYEGHRTGVDQTQNPAYRSVHKIEHMLEKSNKQVQPSDAEKPQFPTSRVQKTEREFEKTNKDVRYDENQGLSTQPVHQDAPEHDDWKHDKLEEEPKLNPANPLEESGDKGSLDEYMLDRTRHGPAGSAATLPKSFTDSETIKTGVKTDSGSLPSGEEYKDIGIESRASDTDKETYRPDSGSAWRMSEGGTRERIEGDAADDVTGTRKAKAPGATGFLREPFSEPDLSQHLPAHYSDQQARRQFMNDEHDLIPHPDFTPETGTKGLDLSGTLQDQLERFGKMTDETNKEFGALLIRRDGQVILDQVQIGEDHEINIEPTRPLAENEEILGSFHIHPSSGSFSVWDMTSFLNSDWEQASILRAADGSIIVAVKTPETRKLTEDPEKVRDQYKDWTNEQFAKEFGFLLYRGSPEDLEQVGSV